MIDRFSFNIVLFTILVLLCKLNSEHSGSRTSDLDHTQMQTL